MFAFRQVIVLSRIEGMKDERAQRRGVEVGGRCSKRLHMVQAVDPCRNDVEHSHLGVQVEKWSKSRIMRGGGLRGFIPSQAHLLVDLVHVCDHALEFFE